MRDETSIGAPERLSTLAQWQLSKASTLGARLTGAHMPLGGRSDFAVLAALDEYGSLSQAELGRRLGLDRNDVSGIVNRLEAADQVRREPDAGDRRRNVISITANGALHFAGLRRIADAVQDELLRGLSPDERRQLGSLLAKVLDSHAPQPA